MHLVVAAGLTATLTLAATPAGATARPAEPAPATVPTPSVAGAKDETTLGAGYLSAPGQEQFASTQFVVPRLTCTADGVAFFGTTGFSANGTIDAYAAAAVQCSGGVERVYAEYDDAVNGKFSNNTVISPGDTVDTRVDETSTETYLETLDVTTGQDIHTQDAPHSIDARFLLGLFNSSGVGQTIYYALPNVGAVAFSDNQFDGNLNKAVAARTVERLHGVVRAKVGRLRSRHQAFTVTWKHS